MFLLSLMVSMKMNEAYQKAFHQFDSPDHPHRRTELRKSMCGNKDDYDISDLSEYDRCLSIWKHCDWKKWYPEKAQEFRFNLDYVIKVVDGYGCWIDENQIRFSKKGEDKIPNQVARTAWLQLQKKITWDEIRSMVNNRNTFKRWRDASHKTISRLLDLPGACGCGCCTSP